MGHDGLTAGPMNSIRRLFYCTPVWWHVAGLALGEVLFEDLRNVVAFTDFHQITGKVRTGNRPALRQPQCAFPGTGYQGFLQPASHLLRTFDTQGSL